jgi:hypothetical protein
MQRRRSWIVFVIVALMLLALLMQRVAAPSRAAPLAAERTHVVMAVGTTRSG